MSTLRVLVIDDDAFVRDLVGEMLDSGPYEVHTAATGELGLEALAADSGFDVVLLDVDLGAGKNGFETCKGIMELPAPPPVVFFTSHAEEDFVASALGLGAKAYVCKPFSALELLREIQRVTSPVSD